jgi:DNA-binding response OmpR family regulator
MTAPKEEGGFGLARVLICEDEPLAVRALREYLKDVDWIQVVGEARNGSEAVRLVQKLEPDLIFLDVRMPGLSGLEVLERITHRSAIIFTTAYDEYALSAFEFGALDYLVKPFEPKELMARVKAVLRRINGFEGTAEEVVYPQLVINKSDYSITFRGKKEDVPPKELELFYFLASHPNQVFTREQLLEKLWGYDFVGDTRTIDVHVKRLREKFSDEAGIWEIKTVWGVGYKFEVR